jgi:hypothetical protein
MTKGVLLIARNNTEVDYIKQAVFLANRIKKYLNLPTSLITDNVKYLEKTYDASVFDKIIDIDDSKNYTYRKYNDGNYTRKQLEFKNTNRSSVYDLTPYDETLLMDTDFIISNSVLTECFNQTGNFLIYKDGFEFSGWRDLNEFKYISEVGPDFYWATVVFFRKTEENKIFFNLLKHIQDNWSHYRLLYQLNTDVFRNDFAFSIAIHIMNGYTQGIFAKKMPGTLYYSTDRDLLIDLKDDEFTLLVESQNSSYFPVKIKGSNVHVMNKFSLGRIIDNG